MKRLTLGLLIATAFTSAHADFTILDPSQAAPKPAPVAAQPVPMVPASAPVAGVQAQKLPAAPARNLTSLADTLKKIAPKSWKVYSDKSLNSSLPVEYTPAVDWKQSLSVLATRYNLIFTVDEAKKIIKVDQGPGGMRDTALDNQKLAQNNLVPEPAPSALAPDGSLQLVVKDNQRLSEALEAFLKAGNWHLVWEAGSDIVVTKGFTVSDKDLSELLTRALSKFKLHASLHPKNNTAVVQSDAMID